MLVILDGSSRDLGTSFQLINEVIIPSLGNDKSRLLVAINQADVAMKGRHWNYEANEPETPLIDFLNDKVISTRNRIREATGVDIEPIYYAAGYKDEDDEQLPWNLSKLLAFMLRHTKPEKRAPYIGDLNNDKKMWERDENLEKHREEIQQSLWESVTRAASEGADIGGKIGELVAGSAGKAIGSAIGGVVGGFIGGVTSFIGGIFG
ncbi:hypothetical protein NX722_06445 [Endozoicomonas gorgoniicola]|uniref:Uncharacterized protein n=1 Tax=Endozoicomonas gorgoniicola TaxID=1234144 RepID=A0ABT3MSF2_9GAMM|nr:hypothetical protein [Endozoicomonas gorgoniicola]MCW7552293.1 hypothetical protein [Endozoicomonas gorgoniicola]